jgi:hypothetical protein
VNENNIYKSPESTLQGTNEIPQLDKKTIINLSPEKSSWVIPLVSIFSFSLVDFKSISPLMSVCVLLLVQSSFVLAFFYSIWGINKFRKYRGGFVITQSIIGLLLSLGFFALLIAIMLPAFLRSVHA